MSTDNLEATTDTAVVVKGNEERAEKNRAAVALLDAWAADESGYDERVWPTVKRLLEENHSGPRALFGE